MISWIFSKLKRSAPAAEHKPDRLLGLSPRTAEKLRNLRTLVCYELYQGSIWQSLGDIPGYPPPYRRKIKVNLPPGFREEEITSVTRCLVNNSITVHFTPSDLVIPNADPAGKPMVLENMSRSLSFTDWALEFFLPTGELAAVFTKDDFDKAELAFG